MRFRGCKGLLLSSQTIGNMRTTPNHPPNQLIDVEEQLSCHIVIKNKNFDFF